MAGENEFLLHALLMGIFITFLYDLLRIFRRVVPHNGFFVSMEDLAFWIYCGGEVFLLMYHEGNGSLRWFAVLGAVLGMLLYRKLVSRLFVKYTSLLLCKVLRIVGRILEFLSRPFRAACKRSAAMAARAGCGIRGRYRRGMRYFKNRLTRSLKELKMVVKK